MSRPQPLFDVGDRVQYVEDPSDVGTVIERSFSGGKGARPVSTWSYTVDFDGGNDGGTPDKFVEGQLRRLEAVATS